MLVDDPEQIVWFGAATFGVGLTFTVTLCVAGDKGQTGVVKGVVTLNTYTTSIGLLVAFTNGSVSVFPFRNVVVPAVTVPPVTNP